MNEKKKLPIRLDRIPGVTYIFLIVFVIASVGVPRFFSVGNLSTMLLQACTLTLLSVAMALTLMMGSIDLSMGGVVSMAGVIMAFIMRDGGSAYIAILAGLVIGTLFGMLNGLMVAKLKIPAFIATFGSMGIAQSIANTISDERTVSWEATAKTKLIDFLGSHAVTIKMGEDAAGTLTISNLLIITIVVVAIVWLIFRKTTLGSNLYALGANEETARLSGINVTWWRVAVFMISGLLAALGSVIVMVRTNSVQPTIGTNLEFQACVAAVLGGNVMEGGKGSVPGAVLGALTLYIIRNAMSLLGIDTSWVQVVIGCVLVVGMLLNNATAARERESTLAALRRARADRRKGDAKNE